jgi:hypothetical protein
MLKAWLVVLVVFPCGISLLGYIVMDYMSYITWLTRSQIADEIFGWGIVLGAVGYMLISLLTNNLLKIWGLKS